MIAYRVSGYGFLGKRNVIVKKREISHTTKRRVFYEGGSENKIAVDLYDPHQWFKEEVDALQFALRRLQEELEYIEEHKLITINSLSNVNTRLKEISKDG